MSEEKVGIGEVKVEQGDVILATYGLGSCVALMLYDPEKKVGGLAHILLPSGNSESPKCPKGAIEQMLAAMSLKGGKREKIIAKIVGGSSMLDGFERRAIGKRNVSGVREELKNLGIPVIAEDVLGNYGRSVFFDLNNGKVFVRSFKHGDRTI
jgi:chemotaxis protein CheD